MPAVIPAAAAAWAGAAATAASWGAAAVIVAQVSAAIVAAAFVAKIFREKQGFEAEQRGQQVVLRSAVVAQRIIYGEAVVSGPLVYSRVSRDTAFRSEHHVVPPSPPYQVAVGFAGNFASNSAVVGVGFSFGPDGFLMPIVPLSEGSAYTVSNGVYTFHPNLAGQTVLINYYHTGDESANSWLHMVIPLAYHQVQEIGDVYFNSDVITSGELDSEGNVVSGKYAGYAKIRKHLGAPGQVADGYLVSISNGQWTSAHVGAGVAYIVVSLRREQNLFVGVPNIRAKVKGALLYDPRTGNTAWSNNWALVVRDYLTRAEGLGASSSEIDDDLMSAAANVSDEDVDLDAVPNTQKRYTADGVVSLDGKPLDVLKELLSAGAGMAVYSVGTWDLYAGAYVAPTKTITVSDLRAELVGAPDLARRDIFNAVRGTLINPDADWQATSFPPVENATYQAEDGGEQIVRDIELPFTNNVVRAQRIAKIVLERARQGATLNWPGKLTCFRLNTWETVNVNVAQLGYSPKVFRVNGWQWTPGGGVDLALQEEAAGVYDWNFGLATTHDLAPNTLLAGVGPLAPPGAPMVSEELYETRDSRGVAARALLTWTGSIDVYVTDYEPEYKLVSDLAWTRLPPTNDTASEVNDIAPGTYDFRVRARDGIGRTSPYTQTRAEIRGLTAAPSAPTGISIQAGGGTARLKFDPSPDLDVRRGGRVLVRHCHEGVTPVDWLTSFSIGEAQGWPGDSTQVDVPLKPGTYLVKFRDSSGHESAAWAEIETKQASALAWSSLASLTFDPTFTGSHSGTLVDSGSLTLGGLGLWDDIADIDAEADIDGSGGIAEDGTWTAGTGIDLTAVSACRVTSRIEGSVDNALDQIDDRTGNVDDWLDWDGDTLGGSHADVWMELRETDDDPAGSPVWSVWKRIDSAEFVARAFQFRARLTTSDPAYRPLVDALRVSVEEVV